MVAATSSQPVSHMRQSVIGLGLGFAILGAWLALHFYAMFAFEFTASSWPLAIVLAAAICWLSVGLFIVSHDAMHGSLAPSAKTASAMIGAAVLFIYAGFSWRKMRSAHFDHHKYAGHAGDPDFDEHNPSSFWRWYFTFLRRYFGVGSFVFVTLVSAVYWLALDVPMANILLLYAVPAIASSVQLFYFGTYRPHHHNGQNFDDRHNARSEDFGPLASLASCYHFGYHHEHHCHPDTPWWALPALRRQTHARLHKSKSTA